MCAIVGGIVWRLNEKRRLEANRILNEIFIESHERGRDGRGWIFNTEEGLQFESRSTTRGTQHDWRETAFLATQASGTIIGNLRAEPTTEYVATKRPEDQQPYSLNGWSIVHNGTIANDKDIRKVFLNFEYGSQIDSAAIVELLANDPINIELSPGDDKEAFFSIFKRTIGVLEGSYAILATHQDQPGALMFAADYRPIWYVTTPYGVFFASARHYFPKNLQPRMIRPYTAGTVTEHEGRARFATIDLLSRRYQKKALVVCSGGLDSVVAATYSKVTLGYDTSLIHFQYGSRAEGPELTAVRNVAKLLGMQLIIKLLPVYDKGDSPLLNSDAAIAGGEAGAEFASEWVPARNLLLLAVATAYAEAQGYDVIVLGNNLEEAGAYPDNEPEFIDRFNDLLPFAIGNGKKIEVIMPVGNMMKHEIVALGYSIDAPMHLTWSCYRAGDIHCGKCGPCYMRRKAFQINRIADSLTYSE